MTALLRINQCGIRFGGLKALDQFSMELAAGELAAIIGPNGAGKTTLFNLLTGVYRPSEGEIYFNGSRLNDLQPYQISRAGVARTFQNIRLFPDLSVEDNVLVAFHHQLRTSLAQAVWRGLWGRQRYREEEERIRELAWDLLRIFKLDSLVREVARNLPYGAQRRLEIVRALATNPRLLLLDEPAAGMNTTEKQELMQLIRLVHARYRMAILLIEHDMGVVMTLCPRIVVLDYGEVIATGSPDEIQKNPRVIEAYLGTVHASSD